MSGGHFGEYDYYRVSQFADSLENDLDNNSVPNEHGWARDYCPEVVALLRRKVDEFRLLSEEMRHIDYLYAGDHGEESFLEHMKKLETKRTK